MVEAVAFCPMTPLLVPEVAQGAAGELDDLRNACREAIRAAHAPGRRWVVLGPGDTSRRYPNGSRGSLAPWGVPLLLTLATGTSAAGEDGPTPSLPLSLTVGAWLLRDALGDDVDATAWSVADDTDEALDNWDDDCWVPEGEVAVLAVGDGSARRTVKAPGHLDARAAAFDSCVEQALREGDPAALAGLDRSLGTDLLAAGVPVWRAVGAIVRDRSWTAELLCSGDPYGVAYPVASWLATDHLGD